MKDRPVDFNVTEYERLINKFQDLHCHFTLSNYQLLLKKNIHNYIKKLLCYFFIFHLHVCMRLFFIYFNQNDISQQIKHKI